MLLTFEIPTSHILDMDSDVIFRDAMASCDFESLKTVLQDDSYVDIESQNFVEILRLCITNGDEAAFAKLLLFVPNMRLKSIRVVNAPQQGVWRKIRDHFRQSASEFVQIIFSCYCLSFLVKYSAVHSTGLIQTLSAWTYVKLQYSATPFGFWITQRIFKGLKCRFSQHFLLDTFDGALRFMWLAIATTFISPRSWMGFHLHKSLYSPDSIFGSLLEDFLAENMPKWRRSYFSIVFGSDSFLARTPQLEASPIDHGEFILSCLLQSRYNTEALMIRFLERTTFEDVNDESGYGQHILNWATEIGSLEIIRKLLNLGIEIDTYLTGPDPHRYRVTKAGTALFWAAMEGNSRIVEFLLHNGADPNHATRPLIGATSGSHMSHLKQPISSYATCVSHLLAAGANPDSMDKYGRSALSWSTDPDQKCILELLLNAGANPDTSDNNLKLPIHYAARIWRSDKIVEALIERTTNLDAVDDQGTSALTWSLRSAVCPPTMKLLADRVSDINSGGGIYGSPLEIACRSCSISIVKMLIDKGANPNFYGGTYSSYLGAVLTRSCDDGVLELLLSHGADPNVRTSDGKQALHIAAECCSPAKTFEVLLKHGGDVHGVYRSRQYNMDIESTPLGILCCESTEENAAMFLLEAGADPNCTGLSGETPLQAACSEFGSSKLAQELIDRGADIAAQSLGQRDTALHIAATAAKSDIIKVLLEKGANANARNAELRTPLHEACRQEVNIRSSREKQENPFEALHRAKVEEKEKNLVESIKLLLTHGQADPKAKDIDGFTPLHHAIQAHNRLNVDTLMRYSPGDIIFEPDLKGMLPLHLAGAAGIEGALDYLMDTSTGFWSHRESQQENEREMLIEGMRNSINAIDNSGDTALHHAARHGHEQFVSKLRSLGGGFVDLDIRNHEGRTALDLAKENHHVWLVSELKKRVAHKIDDRTFEVHCGSSPVLTAVALLQHMRTGLSSSLAHRARERRRQIAGMASVPSILSKDGVLC